MANTEVSDRARLAALLPPDFDFGRFEDGLIVLSSEVVVRKPDAQMFAVALSRAQLAPERVLFVGDDPIDLLAAQRIGMQALRLGGRSADFETLANAALGVSGDA